VTDKEIEAKVIEIVAEQLGYDKAEIKPETSFVNDLNVDSLDQVEIVMALEDAFESVIPDFKIPDDEAEKLKTVGSAVEFIIKAKSAAPA